MKDIRNIHRQAIELAKNADQARLDGNLRLFRQLTEEAYQLEKEASDELISHPESEPTRSVLFRSAATLAFNLGKLLDARQLIETALSGSPFPEIKAELQELQQKIEVEMAHQSDYTDQQDYSSLSIAGESEFTYERQQLPDFRSVFDQYLSPKLFISFSAADRYDIQEMYSRMLFETTSIIFIFVDNQETAQYIFSKTLKSFQTQFHDFEVSSFSQARTLLYLTAHHHGRRYRRDNDIEGEINLGILDTLPQHLASRTAIKRFFTAYDRLSAQTTSILDLFLEGITTSEIASQMGLTAKTVLRIKNKAINLLPESK